MHENGGPYFPHSVTVGELHELNGGISKRERCALEILCSLLVKNSALGRDEMVAVAVAFADALIERASE